jgi:predicted RND superfamily exporter protein
MVSTVSDLITLDLVRLIPISFLIIALILYFGLRSLRGVIMPLVTAALATVWSLGIMSLLGYQMSMVSNNIPIILLAVGSAYTIHVLNRIKLEREKELKKAIVRALRYIIIPVILASLTTIIGFLSFVFGAYLNMIRDFGIFTALGTAIAALLSIFFVPAIISLMPPRKKSRFHPDMKNRQNFLTKRILIPIKNLIYLRPNNILITWIILIIISIGGIFMIKRSVDINDYFRKDNPTRVAEELMADKFGGSKPVFVHIKGDMQDPSVLKTIMVTEEYMEKSPYIYSTQSIADLIAQMIGVLEGTEEIPEDRIKIEQLWFLLDGQEYLERFVSSDLSEGVILSKFTASDNKSKKEFSDYMDKFIEENSTEECTIAITGMPFVDLTMDRSLVNSQFGSLSIAIVFVVIIVGLILKSFKSGIFATIPIIASIVILFGLMGYIGISLNLATVLVASLTLGIGIDYSIHIMSHFNHSYKKGSDPYRALRDTILISGKAIVINILSVAGGFLVLLFSEMVPLEYFGLLVSISMIGSGLGALTLLPVILILVHRKYKISLK